MVAKLKEKKIVTVSNGSMEPSRLIINNVGIVLPKRLGCWGCLPVFGVADCSSRCSLVFVVSMSLIFVTGSSPCFYELFEFTENLPVINLPI